MQKQIKMLNQMIWGVDVGTDVQWIKDFELDPNDEKIADIYFENFFLV